VNKILHIETATDICSVALSSGEDLVDHISVHERNIHSAKLSIFIDQIMKRNKWAYTDLQAASVSKGPGSFTGLRIGISVAKGICYGANCKLIGVNTLRSLVTALKNKMVVTDEKICSLIDARNNEVYFAVYDKDYQSHLAADIGKLDAEALKKIIAENKVVFIGDGVSKWTQAFREDTNCRFYEEMLPDARNLIPLAHQKFIRGEFEDLASFEPYYLRDFKAKKVSLKIKKILNTN
jgi:tRNA threonylcarbamoyladenosine biosynthesis protein TsaB